MPNELATTTPELTDLLPTLKKWLKVTGIAQNLTADEQETFLEIASASRLNPFKKEIYVSKIKDRLSFITGFEVYLKRAERTGRLDGWNVGFDGEVLYKAGERGYYVDRTNSTLTATVTIYRKDWSHPFTHSVSVKEFCGSSPIWVSSTRYMLGKTAISQGFRLAFPDEIGSLPITEFEESSEAMTGGQPVNDWMVERAQKLATYKADQSEAQAYVDTIKQFVDMNLVEDAHKLLLTLEKLPDTIIDETPLQIKKTKKMAAEPNVHAMQLTAAELIKFLSEKEIDRFNVEIRRTESFRDHLGTDTLRDCTDGYLIYVYIKNLAKRITDAGHELPVAIPVIDEYDKQMEVSA